MCSDLLHKLQTMTPPKKIAPAKTPERKQRGRTDRSAAFPVAASAGEMPADYAAWLAEIKSRIQGERLRLVLASNSVMVMLYWDIGRRILQKQAEQGYGTKVVDRLAADLREAFPEMKGFSPRNLKYMRAFAAAWPDREVVQAALAQVTWYHNLTLLEKLDKAEDRLWYAARTIEHGWSRNILSFQIEGQAHRRHGKAQNNFPATLPPPESDMAVQVFKDPYVFEFLGLKPQEVMGESQLEDALLDKLQDFLLELGHGFCFEARQKRLLIGGEHFFVDLVFYHRILKCHVLIELKNDAFKHEHLGQLNSYVGYYAKNEMAEGDQPPVGILLCTRKNEELVEYALAGMSNQLFVSRYQVQLPGKEEIAAFLHKAVEELGGGDE